MAENLCVELAESLCLVLGQGILPDKGIYFIYEAVVGLLVSLGLGQLFVQSSKSQKPLRRG